jgi:hypothetical protein
MTCFGEPFHGLLRRMCIVLCLDEILCRCLLSLFGLWCHLILKMFCFLVKKGCLWFIYYWQWSIEVSHYHCVGNLCFKSSSIYLMKLGVPILSTYKLTIVISSWCIVSFVSMKWPFFVSSNLTLKSALSFISITISACFFLGGGADYLLLKPVPSFYHKPAYFCLWDVFLVNNKSLNLPF